ncbi:nicotinate-nucleotide-dimethylbenzimidazole phosphoribosyltransferase [Parasphingorhabdus marina DSM 22363]|uniref:Nicotinate-nucleotide--dimethylbenzimidazole phosphoribosyltransferase n=1 Tax=Parasphingorhabdus marina DSM 22363 TaxID=1123272 RepID=A0A1N6D0Q0_9SPHN|nr:nicotinate-nucleotide--dimethylbenzimidazole phosphoribosyltransferase [Parasphingorhabdus marina]SIN64390.1 nicotinate-nucleotide-dimethylbenzimidazole phosphoribosyltransferase [Parasphingorhabdus marina DSM 22363]
MTVTRETVVAHLDALAKPQGSMGHLEELAIRLAVVQQSLQPITRPRRMTLFAADHGVVESGVSAWPSAVTTVMMETIIAQKATSTALAAAQDVDVRLVDMGTIVPPAADRSSKRFRDARIAAGTANLALGPAMTKAQFQRAWAAGEEEAIRAQDHGHMLLMAGEMGIGNTTPAACLTMLLTGSDANVATGRGAGADDAILAKKRDIVARATGRAASIFDEDPMTAIAALAGFEIAAMAGYFAQGARQGSTLLLDGYVSTAAALIAEQLSPGSVQQMIAAHLSAEPGHQAALDHLGLEPLLEWQMRLGEGTGALVAVPMLDSAAALLGDVARLADILP